MSERYLIVRDIETREEISRVRVTGRSENTVERVMRGMMINMRDGLFIEDTALHQENEG